MRKRVRQHYQLEKSSDVDPFLLWGSLIILGFLAFTLFLGFNALEEIPESTTVNEVSQPKETNHIQLIRKKGPSSISSKRN